MSDDEASRDWGEGRKFVHHIPEGVLTNVGITRYLTKSKRFDINDLVLFLSIDFPMMFSEVALWATNKASYVRAGAGVIGMREVHTTSNPLWSLSNSHHYGVEVVGAIQETRLGKEAGVPYAIHTPAKAIFEEMNCLCYVEAGFAMNYNRYGAFTIPLVLDDRVLMKATDSFSLRRIESVFDARIEPVNLGEEIMVKEKDHGGDDF